VGLQSKAQSTLVHKGVICLLIIGVSFGLGHEDPTALGTWIMENIEAPCASDSVEACPDAYSQIWSFGVDGNNNVYHMGTQGIFRLTAPGNCGLSDAACVPVTPPTENVYAAELNCTNDECLRFFFCCFAFVFFFLKLLVPQRNLQRQHPHRLRNCQAPTKQDSILLGLFWLQCCFKNHYCLRFDRVQLHFLISPFLLQILLLLLSERSKQKFRCYKFLSYLFVLFLCLLFPSASSKTNFCSTLAFSSPSGDRRFLKLAKKEAISPRKLAGGLPPEDHSTSDGNGVCPITHEFRCGFQSTIVPKSVIQNLIFFPGSL
jgi:hypothetical protein